jgi:hypothetical protein
MENITCPLPLERQNGIDTTADRNSKGTKKEGKVQKNLKLDYAVTVFKPSVYNTW